MTAPFGLSENEYREQSQAEILESCWFLIRNTPAPSPTSIKKIARAARIFFWFVLSPVVPVVMFGSGGGGGLRDTVSGAGGWVVGDSWKVGTAGRFSSEPEAVVVDDGATWLVVLAGFV